MNIYCQLSGYHQDEPLELLCINPECIQNNKVLNCVACMEENHCGHPIIHYKKFVNLIQKQGTQLVNDIDCRIQESAAQSDLIGKLKNILKQLTELQEIVNDAINKQKDMIERKLSYYEQFSCALPTYEIFTKAFKQHDQNLIQKLMCQFFLKVEYNTKRQDFNVRREYLLDQSEETDGENLLFRRLKEVVDTLRCEGDTHNLTQQSLVESVRKLKTPSLLNEFKRSAQRIPSYKRTVSMEKSPGSPDDKMSVTQSLSQFYYKPNVPKKRVGQQISMIETSNSFITNYSFHAEFFGQGLQVTSKQVKLILDSDRGMALIKPSIYGSGLTREQKITLSIKVCRNSNQRYPMAVGICDQSKLKDNNYMFSGQAEHVPGSNNKDHGCYLLNANGFIRSMTGPDLVRSSPNLRFYSNSTIEMTFKPFHQQLIINRDTQVQTTIPIEMKKDQKLFFCVRLADLHDCIEIQ